MWMAKESSIIGEQYGLPTNLFSTYQGVTNWESLVVDSKTSAHGRQPMFSINLCFQFNLYLFFC